MGGIYSEPEFYVAACAYRDVPGDVAAVARWWHRHGRDSQGGLPASVLELAAGPAEHARELARRGVAATALDLNPAMCAWAAAQAEREAVPLTVVQADMRDFTIDGTPFDLAITMLNSLCHLMTLDDMIDHLRAVRRHLAEDGLYVIELAHPADVLSATPRTSSDWSTTVDGGTVTVRWGGQADRIDPVSQVTDEHVTVTFRNDDGTLRTVTDVVPNRFWTATEFEAAIRLAGGFAIVARYGDFDVDLSVDAPGAWRMIFVLCGRPADG